MNKIEAMHEHFGKKDGFKCGDCCNLLKKRANTTFYKCTVYGCSSSIATDWAKKWIACGMFNIKTPQDKHRALWIKEDIKEPINGQIKIGEEVKE
jgi:hypothetical protein